MDRFVSAFWYHGHPLEQRTSCGATDTPAGRSASHAWGPLTIHVLAVPCSLSTAFPAVHVATAKFISLFAPMSDFDLKDATAGLGHYLPNVYSFHLIFISARLSYL